MEEGSILLAELEMSMQPKVEGAARSAIVFRTKLPKYAKCETPQTRANSETHYVACVHGRGEIVG